MSVPSKVCNFLSIKVNVECNESGKLVAEIES